MKIIQLCWNFSKSKTDRKNDEIQYYKHSRILPYAEEMLKTKSEDMEYGEAHCNK